VKLSISVPADDLEFIDSYAGEHGVATRSGVVQRALSLLRSSQLGADYEAAWAEWAAGDAPMWEATAGDGAGDASR